MSKESAIFVINNVVVFCDFSYLAIKLPDASVSSCKSLRQTSKQSKYFASKEMFNWHPSCVKDHQLWNDLKMSVKNLA
jgi:hypothetical protein